MSQQTGNSGKLILQFQSQNWWAGDPGEPGSSFKCEGSLLKKQEELMLQGKFEGRLLEKSPAQGRPIILFYSDLQLIGHGPPAF